VAQNAHAVVIWRCPLLADAVEKVAFFLVVGGDGRSDRVWPGAAGAL